MHHVGKQLVGSAIGENSTARGSTSCSSHNKRALVMTCVSDAGPACLLKSPKETAETSIPTSRSWAKQSAASQAFKKEFGTASAFTAINAACTIAVQESSNYFAGHITTPVLAHEFALLAGAHIHGFVDSTFC